MMFLSATGATGGDTLAQLIYDRLTERGYRVFLDIESLRCREI